MNSPELALTVVIPVWGARYAATLPRAVKSVRAGGEEVPIVVVDNDSDAELPEIAGVEVVRSPRRLSAGGARNLGLERVGTDYVVMLDADDELLPGALPTLLEGITADPATSVYSMSLIESETGERHRNPRRFVAYLARAPRALALATALWSMYPIQGAAAMRTASVRDAGGYLDRSGGEDRGLAASLALRGRVVIDSRPGLLYHRRTESLWRPARGALELLAAAREIRRRLRSDPAAPRWLRAAIPPIAIGQTLLILGVRPIYRALRAALALVRGRGAGSGAAPR